MRSGILTGYRIGHNSYGISVLNVFPEFVHYDYRKERMSLYHTQYYIKHEDRLHFLWEYELNTFIANQKYNSRRVKALAIRLMNQFNAG